MTMVNSVLMMVSCCLTVGTAAATSAVSKSDEALPSDWREHLGVDQSRLEEKVADCEQNAAMMALQFDSMRDSLWQYLATYAEVADKVENPGRYYLQMMQVLRQAEELLQNASDVFHQGLYQLFDFCADLLKERMRLQKDPEGVLTADNENRGQQGSLSASMQPEDNEHFLWWFRFYAPQIGPNACLSKQDGLRFVAIIKQREAEIQKREEEIQKRDRVILQLRKKLNSVEGQLRNQQS